MAIIKSYTDLEQSKKLAEILPLKSADMYYVYDIPYAIPYENRIGVAKPCWSLAALLGQLKSEIQLKNKQILFLHTNVYEDIDYEIRYTNSWTGEVFITEADNPVDACYEMILKLNELKLL